jgi:hypothetical protein
MTEPITMKRGGDDSAVVLDSVGFEWRAATTSYPLVGVPIGDRIAKATPAADELLEWTYRTGNQPPDSWWDDDTDPFSPET